MGSPDSTFFLPAFNLVFPALLYFALSQAQNSFFINQGYSQDTEENPTSGLKVLKEFYQLRRQEPTMG